MKKLLLVWFLGSCVFAFGQGARFGDANPTQTTTIIPGTSGLIVKVIPGATINFCSWPANAVPCTNKVQTYTDYTLQTTCPTSTQVVLSPTTNCVGTADAYGNWGVWVAPGLYQYTFTYQGNSYGPFFAVPTGNGVASVNCPSALNGSLAAFTSPTGLSCDPNMGTDFAGNGFSQSWATLGAFNGFYTLIGGGSDPGTATKFKLPANAFRWLAANIPTPYYARVPTTHCAVGQVWNVISSTTDANGDIVDSYGCLTPGGNVSITATLPIVVTPSPITGTGVISCPTCNASSAPQALNPSTPTVTPQGTTGATNYSYVIQGCEDGPTCTYHSAPTTAGTTSTGNATLSNTNNNLITAYGDTLYGYRCFNVYRTVGGATQGKIITCGGKAVKDTGLAADGTTAPTGNTTILDATGLTRPNQPCNSLPHTADGIDALPCSPAALNDEFSETFGSPGDVNDGFWTQINAGSATYTYTNGTISIAGTGAAGDSLHCLFHAIPSTPFAFVSSVYYNTTFTGNNLSFLAFRESATGKIVTVGPQIQNGGNSAMIVSAKWTSPTVNSVYNHSTVAFTSQPYLMKIGYDGTNTEYMYSPDGIIYTTALTEAKNAFFTTAPDQYGVCLDAFGGTSASEFDYIRQTTY